MPFKKPPSHTTKGHHAPKLCQTSVVHALLTAIRRPAFIMTEDGHVVMTNSASAPRFLVAQPSDDGSTTNAFDQLPCLQEALKKPEHIVRLKQGLCLEQLCIFHNDDSLRSLTIHPIFDDEGTLTYLAVIENDRAETEHYIEELRRERQRFLYLLETLPGFIYFITPEKTISYTNLTFRKIFGNPTSRHCRDIVQCSGDRCDLCPAIESLHSERTVEWELTYKDRVFHIYSYPMTDTDNSVVAVVFGIDVTAKRLAEKALRTSEANYRAIFNEAPVGIFQTTPEGVFITINPALASVLGYDSPEAFMEAVSSSEQLYFHSHQRWVLLRLLQQQGMVNDFQSPFKHKNGTPIWMSIYIRETRDETGTVKLHEGFAIDISVSKQALADLANSERQLKAIVENAREGIVIITDDRIVFVNPFMMQFTGYTEEELINAHFIKFIHPNDQNIVSQRYAQRITGKETVNGYDFRLITKDNMFKWVQVTAATFDWDGQPATLNFLSDITDKKQVEHALKQVLEDQENLILARTQSLRETNSKLEREMKNRQAIEQSLLAANAQLTKEIEEHKSTARQLEAAKRRADKAAKAKSAFLANMSHEIRTPLNVILGMTEVALHTPPQEGDVRHLEMIKEAGDSLLTVINDVLDFSKIEAHKLTLEKTPFDLYFLVTMLRNSFADQAKSKGLTLELDIHQTTPQYVKGDPSRLRQILFNLLSNALKFTKDGSISISVQPDTKHKHRKSPHRRKPPDTPTILFMVKDTGVGIAREKLGSIFESFHQADTSISRRFGGTGLGLSISSRLASQMGGRIWAKSQIDKGSTFYLTVRLETATAQEFSQVQKQYRLKSSHSTQAREILLVEDSSLNAELVKNILIPQGHHVTHAAHGHEALNILAKQDFDLILMDIQMPEMDGVEVTRRIRNHTTLKVPRSIPIIAMTAHAMPEDRRALLAAGLSDYIAKPITIETLLSAIDRATDHDSSSVTSQSTSKVPEDTPPRPHETENTHVDSPSNDQQREAEVQQALARLGGNEELLAILQTVFLRDGQNDMEQLETNLHKNPAEAAGLAHTIKGNALSIGEVCVAEIAKQLETALKEQRGEALTRLFTSLKIEFQKTIDYLLQTGISPQETPRE
ncbi:PAS domain S-box protein [Desulfovibrio inopinatus]|uniref:PAS domain S-box protein n=1 Tax=Desulfovibrio inopinatus TaxID=102109 RepID=UPI00040CF42F|nr:PAS domain S-box protein [Desulfovibrio inopinatus]